VGITTHIYTDQQGFIGIAFALPAAYAEELGKKWVSGSHVTSEIKKR